jgi:outer membrane lipoprotein carrier protein
MSQIPVCLRHVSVSLATALLLLVSPVHAQDDAARQLDELLGSIQTFQADVRQLIVESSGGVLEESIIKFKLKRPDGFYWETLEPFPELIVTDGKTLWNYQPDLLQVTLETWESERSELAAQLLSGRMAEIEADYFITGGDLGNGSAWEFVLEPVDPASLYERVTLYFRERRLDAIHVDNGNGQRTFWEFFEHVLDAPLADEEFVFTPPVDIEVVDNRVTP